MAGQATKEQESRARVREYEARLAAAGESVAVLARFAQAREQCGAGSALEICFAEALPEGGLPAGVWVALRQDDLGAVLATLVAHASEQFLIVEHEQLDASYKLTTVAESRGLPDVDRLIDQVAAFIEVPRDVVAIVCGWGPDDPRAQAEIDRLIGQRYSPHAATAASVPVAGLAMSSSEFAAVLSLTPEQQGVLATLVRQTVITVTG
jgi:hypothetical protein